ncbi:ARF GAP-like zinc finger-containing protein [Histomonas meleagridis]|uniref:ARF GAP-like zinc finger-containing protein n=1 Tax=Histomonas meleagridis TaxID=135588 RepID=UPI00355A4B19|nr:ARF GAP-like zinc finger-containing protein [Histomonas meleagridis]KAH0803961.1 ARF GAP-like zinc finger-containing protein [Histomonas meleagridis]
MNAPITKLCQLMAKPENSTCADCGAKSPNYCSLNLGIFLCKSCKEIHSTLGNQMFNAISCSDDSWDDARVTSVSKIGNKVANKYWEYLLSGNFQRPNNKQLDKLRDFIHKKYIEKKWANPSKSPPNPFGANETESLDSDSYSSSSQSPFADPGEPSDNEENPFGSDDDVNPFVINEQPSAPNPPKPSQTPSTFQFEPNTSTDNQFDFFHNKSTPKPPMIPIPSTPKPSPSNTSPSNPFDDDDFENPFDASVLDTIHPFKVKKDSGSQLFQLQNVDVPELFSNEPIELDSHALQFKSIKAPLYVPTIFVPPLFRPSVDSPQFIQNNRPIEEPPEFVPMQFTVSEEDEPPPFELLNAPPQKVQLTDVFRAPPFFDPSADDYEPPQLQPIQQVATPDIGKLALNTEFGSSSVDEFPFDEVDDFLTVTPIIMKPTIQETPEPQPESEPEQEPVNDEESSHSDNAEQPPEVGHIFKCTIIPINVNIETPSPLVKDAPLDEAFLLKSIMHLKPEPPQATPQLQMKRKAIDGAIPDFEECQGNINSLTPLTNLKYPNLSAAPPTEAPVPITPNNAFENPYLEAASMNTFGNSISTSPTNILHSSIVTPTPQYPSVPDVVPLLNGDKPVKPGNADKPIVPGTPMGPNISQVLKNEAKPVFEGPKPSFQSGGKPFGSMPRMPFPMNFSIGQNMNTTDQSMNSMGQSMGSMGQSMNSIPQNINPIPQSISTIGNSIGSMGQSMNSMPQNMNPIPPNPVRASMITASSGIPVFNNEPNPYQSLQSSSRPKFK